MRAASKAEPVALALLAYVPFLASSPGRVSADSKQYLYLDPEAFLARAADLWDPHVGAGTVPHQQLGYLFPVGPWFWAFDRLGAPDWVAQRLWLGTLTFVALLGARWLLREVGASGLGALAGALVYGLSPYQLAFTARISVLLLPWAALPWLVGLTMRATRTRSWRAPALLALVLVLAGGINASSLLLVAVGPLLWVVVEVFGSPGRRGAVLASAGRILLLSVGVSVWWLVGVRLQGAYGLPVLQLTENVRTVAEHASPGDVLRGLGNWFFYGRDRKGYSLDQADDYANRSLVVALTYAVPAAGLVAGLLVRWAHRAYFALLVVVGVVLSVGSYPYDDPSPYGRMWRSFTGETSVGLAFRNSPRAVPLVVLGLAGLLAALVSSLPRPRWERAGAVIVAALAVGALLPVWETGWLTDGHDRPEEVPSHWLDAARALDEGDPRTRVLEVPGASFAAHSWGTVVDPLLPGLTHRPSIAREVLPHGTPPSVNLLAALDRRVQLGVLDPASIAPMARLLGVGTVSLRGDLDQSGRFESIAPGSLWRALRQARGLSQPQPFGPVDASGDALPAVALFDVDDPLPIVRTAPAGGPVVVAGDGDGIVDASAAGLLDGRSLLFQSAALGGSGLDAALDSGADLVVTDSNRKRVETWFYSIRDTRGPTERLDQSAPDPTGYDFRLSPFDDAPRDAMTVVRHVGGRVDTTSEGGPDRPEDRGAAALDGDPVTAWRVGGPDPVGHSITVEPASRVRIDHVDLLQPPSARDGRRVARVLLRFDRGEPVVADLDERSLDGGQRISFPPRTVASISIELAAATSEGPASDAPVGFAEVRIPGVRVSETVVLPNDLLRRVGTALDGHRLDLVMTRLRLDLPGTDRLDEEPRLDRTFSLPLARTFAITGTVRSGVSDGVAAGQCRRDLLTVDGAPAPVRVTPRAGSLRLEGCEPVRLTAGEHRVVAAGPLGTAIDVDQLVLSTGPDGAPIATAARGQGQGGPPMGVDSSAGRHRLRIERHAGEPFWVVLGESASRGWHADVDGATVGPRTLVDGYANGWLVVPDGSGPVTLDLRWRPQRLVVAGLVVSGLSVAACALVLVRGRRRPTGCASDLRAGPALARWSWRPMAGPAAAVASAACVGALGVLVATPPVAGIAALATATAGLVPGGRGLLIALAPLALIVSRADARPSLAWIPVLLLAADLVLRSRQGARA